MSEVPFPCHLTHEKSLGLDEGGKETTPLCAGALMYMKKAAKLPRNKEIAEIIKQIDRKDLDNILSVPEFFEYHKQIK